MTPTLRLLPLLLVALTGCFSLGRDEPQQRHYVLGGSAPPEFAPAGRLDGLTLGLRQLDLAAYLNVPFLVVRHGPQQIRFSEFHRWGEDLDGGVNRAVVRYMRDRASFRGIDVVPFPVRARYDYLIQLHLTRFEGLVPEDPAVLQGEANLLATWEIIRQQDGAVLARGTTEYRDRTWTPGDYDGLVTRLDTGLGVLADDLVASLDSLAVPPADATPALSGSP